MGEIGTETVSATQARRFLIQAFGLNGFQTLPDVDTAVQTLGFVQEDSINVCGRMHDLILGSRVRGYTRADLSRYLYESSPRTAFEYYLPNLCVLQLTDYPYFAGRMRERRENPGRYGVLSPDEEKAAAVLFAAIDARGTLFLRDAKALGDAHGHTVSGWGTRTRLLSFVADKLFWQGRLGIAKRDGFLRAFDRIERLLPAGVLRAPAPSASDSARYLLRKQLRARRLFRLCDADRLQLGHETVRVSVESDPRPWHVFAADLPDLLAPPPPQPECLHLLAPLDPLIYDRARTRLLWGFDYTWEVYVPQAKRNWGYFVLPRLCGDRLVGRVEPRICGKTGVVDVVSLAWEPGFDPGATGTAVRERLAALGAALVAAPKN